MIKITLFFSFNLLFLSWAQGAPLFFERACEKGTNITIGATGDILPHLSLQVQAKRQGGFRHIWERISGALSRNRVDIMYGNLETPVAPNICTSSKRVSSSSCSLDRRFIKYGADYISLLKKGFSNTPFLNVSPSLLEDLSESFDVLSTANNHAMDRHSIGVNSTIDQLTEKGFANRYTGTKKSNGRGAWHAEVSARGIRLAFIACTMHTNFINESSTQVMKCYEDRKKGTANPVLLEEISSLTQDYDGVVVTPHWGDEYTPRVDKKRRGLARQFFYHGALVVFGAHPHVIQPWEKHERFQDKFGSEKDRFVIYSLGNFMANQGDGTASIKDVKKRTGVILYLGITKNLSGTFVNGVRFFPYYMTTSSMGPSNKKLSMGFEDQYVLKNRKNIRTYIKNAKKYIRSVLPFENSVLSTDGPVETRSYLSNGELISCN